MSVLNFTYFSAVKDGKLQANVSKAIAADLKRFEGRRIELSFKKLKSTRSGQQNRFLHATFTILATELNQLGNEFTMQEVKDLVKCKFLTIDVFDKNTGEVLGQRIKGTHELSKSEMIEFIDNMINWAALQFNIKLAYPNEEILIEYES